MKRKYIFVRIPRRKSLALNICVRKRRKDNTKRNKVKESLAQNALLRTFFFFFLWQIQFAVSLSESTVTRTLQPTRPTSNLSNVSRICTYFSQANALFLLWNLSRACTAVPQETSVCSLFRRTRRRVQHLEAITRPERSLLPKLESGPPLHKMYIYLKLMNRYFF